MTNPNANASSFSTKVSAKAIKKSFQALQTETPSVNNSGIIRVKRNHIVFADSQTANQPLMPARGRSS